MTMAAALGRAAQAFFGGIVLGFAGNGLLALFSSPLTIGPKNSQPFIPMAYHTGLGLMPVSHGNNRGFGGLALQVALGAASCWAAYAFISTLMPDCIKEILPVNRKLFDRAVKSLGEGIISVRDSLSEQILQLIQTQEEFGEKQDKTLEEIMLVRSDLGDARADLSRLEGSMTRCESSLLSSKRLQAYTSRGVRLLIRCVAALLPGNDQVLAELLQYIKESEGLEDEGTSSSCPNDQIAPTIQERLQTTLDHDNPALVPISEARAPVRNPTPFKTPQKTDNLDAIHSLLDIVRDGNYSYSYQTPIPVSVRG